MTYYRLEVGKPFPFNHSLSPMHFFFARALKGWVHVWWFDGLVIFFPIITNIAKA